MITIDILDLILIIGLIFVAVAIIVLGTDPRGSDEYLALELKYKKLRKSYTELVDVLLREDAGES